MGGTSPSPPMLLHGRQLGASYSKLTPLGPAHQQGYLCCAAKIRCTACSPECYSWWAGAALLLLRPKGQVSHLPQASRGRVGAFFLGYHLSSTSFLYFYLSIYTYEYFYMSIWSVSMPVYHMGAWCPQRPEGDIRSRGAGTTDTYELLCGCWELDLGLLGE